ncbi:hypothetical protein, partial [Acidiferrobacter sp.]
MAEAWTPATVSLKSQLFRLWKAFHKRRYPQFEIMEGCHQSRWSRKHRSRWRFPSIARKVGIDTDMVG